MLTGAVGVRDDSSVAADGDDQSFERLICTLFFYSGDVAHNPMAVVTRTLT
jgi:hypothetical protein